MALNVGELVASIRLDGVSQVDRDLEGVRKNLSATDTALNGLSKVGASAFTAASVGATGLAVVLATTTRGLAAQGVEYNKLQQTSRAALKTLLGGAEEANAQMSKLDDFARNSPFSKGVFIQAQQQLIGFGFEAGKVIPTLDAIQNAVAAVGGSNEQISEIVEIMAKIRSSSKITAEDLNQFGERGLDAATLIGDGMGKTAAQIREDITDGALDAGQALDVLTEQMATKFDGAAGNVKGTFAGTVDRVKAASRDIGAALAQPFVDPNGGGMAVQWGNQVADVLRAVQRETKPVVDFLVMQAQPAFNGISDALQRAKYSVEGFTISDLESGIAAVTSRAPAFGALVGAILGANSGLLQQIPLLGQLVPAINPVAGALIGAAAASPELRDAIIEILGAMSPLIPVAGEVASLLAGSLATGGRVAADVLEAVAPIVELVATTVAGLPEPLIAAGVAFVALKTFADTQMWAGIVRGAQGAAGGLQTFAQQATIVQRAAAANGDSMTTMGSVATAAGRTVGSAAKSMALAFVGNPVGLALTAIALAVGAWSAANAEAEAKVSAHKQAVAEFRSEINATTGQLTEAGQAKLLNNLIEDGTADKLKLAGVALSDYTEGVSAFEEASGKAVDKLVENQLGLVKTESGLKFANETSKALGVSLETLTKAAHGSAEAQAEVDDAMQGSSYSAKYLETTLAKLREQGVNSELLTSFYEQQAAIEGASQAAKLYSDEMAEIRASGGDAAVAQRQLEEALGVVRDTAKSAEERLSALKGVLDLLNGGTQSAAEQQIAIQQSINSLADAFMEGKDGAEGYSSALLDASGKIDLTSSAGLKLAETLKTQGDAAQVAALSAATAAEQAGKSVEDQQKAAMDAMQPYIDALYEQVDAGKLTQEQAQALADTYYGMPSEVAIAVTDNGTVDAQQLKIDALLLALQTSAEGALIPVDADTVSAAEKLLGIDLQTRTLSDGSIVVVADTTSAEASINAITHRRTVYVDVVTSDSTSYSTSPYGNTGQSFEANGGMWSYGVKAFADGGMNRPLPAGAVPSGIYAGGANIVKFAEPETQWEAYISGKPGMQSRNRKVWAEAGRRLGIDVAPFMGGRKQQMADGGMTGARSWPAALQQVGTNGPVNVYITIDGRGSSSDDALARQIEERLMRALTRRP